MWWSKSWRPSGESTGIACGPGTEPRGCACFRVGNMRFIALCSVLAIRLAAQPAATGGGDAEDVLKAARAALGPKLSTVQSLSLWGADQRGSQASRMAFTIDLSGRYLKEQSTLASGGQVQRMGVGGDGAALSGGGMPGDDGGPALSLGLT